MLSQQAISCGKDDKMATNVAIKAFNKVLLLCIALISIRVRSKITISIPIESSGRRQ